MLRRLKLFTGALFSRRTHDHPSSATAHAGADEQAVSWDTVPGAWLLGAERLAADTPDPDAEPAAAQRAVDRCSRPPLRR